MYGPFKQHASTRKEKSSEAEYIAETSIRDLIKLSLRHTLAFESVESVIEDATTKKQVDLELNYGDDQKMMVEISCNTNTFAEHLDRLIFTYGNEKVNQLWYLNFDQHVLESINIGHDDEKGKNTTKKTNKITIDDDWWGKLNGESVENSDLDNVVIKKCRERQFLFTFEDFKETKIWKDYSKDKTRQLHLSKLSNTSINIVNVLTTKLWDVIIVIVNGEIQVLKWHPDPKKRRKQLLRDLKLTKQEFKTLF